MLGAPHGGVRRQSRLPIARPATQAVFAGSGLYGRCLHFSRCSGDLMKVFMLFPMGVHGNPYMRLLVRSLEAAGVSVRFPGEGRLAIWKSMIRWRPEVVHLQWQHHFFVRSSLLTSMARSSQFFAKLIVLRLLGARFVWTVHNIVNHERKFARWELAMCRVLARGSDRLIVHCEAAAAEVAVAFRVSIDRVRVVPHGHFGDAYPPVMERRAARERLGIQPDARVLLFFGQIRRYKGVASLLEAFRQLDSEETRLIIAGQPKPAVLAQELRDQASRDPRVKLDFGFIPTEPLIAYISACDIVVLPYEGTLTSGAAILAASCGRPIIGPRLGCMQDFPADGGIFFDPGHPGGLARALERASEEPLGSMGEVAGNHVQSVPWSVVSALTLDVYREVLGGKD